MPLIVETGSGDSASESYASVGDADVYLANRNMTDWGAMYLTDKEAALRRATDYMQQEYRGRWRGARATSAQALDWPRDNVPVHDAPGGYYSATAVPTEVKNACIAMALKASEGDLAPDIGRETTSESVGPISVTYAVGARQTVRYQSIDNMLSALLKNGGGSYMVRMSRA